MFLESDRTRAVRLALDWLIASELAAEALCFAVDRQANALVLVGQHGGRVRSGSRAVDLRRADHPLTVALFERRPVALATTDLGRGSGVSFRGARVWAIPLRRAETGEERALGLLMCGGEGARRLDDRVGWVAELLAARLLCFDYQRVDEAAQRHENESDLLRAMCDAVTDPVIATDADGRVLAANARAVGLFSAEPSDSENRRRAVALNSMLFSAATFTVPLPGDSPPRELPLVDPRDGEELLFELLASTLPTHLGKVGRVSILRDVTDVYQQAKQHSEELSRKVHEATSEIRRQALEVENAAQLKTRFLATMSHELRTPLNAIIGYSYLLAKRSDSLPAGDVHKIEKIDANARRLLALINDVLDITRIDLGKMPVSLEPTRIASTLEEVMAELEPLTASSPGVQVSWSAPPELPELLTDAGKVRQILVNFVSNALKFTPSGSISVIADYDASSDEVSLAVRDTGIGIAKRDQAHVFDDFQQADSSSTPRSGGTGLGLAICRRLAAILGGRVALRSRVGHGSTFTLHLPRVHPSAAGAITED